jgi:hypothetical protein
MTNAGVLNGYNYNVAGRNDHADNHDRESIGAKLKKVMAFLLDSESDNPYDLPPYMKAKIGLD